MIFINILKPSKTALTLLFPNFLFLSRDKTSVQLKFIYDFKSISVQIPKSPELSFNLIKFSFYSLHKEIKHPLNLF